MISKPLKSDKVLIRLFERDDIEKKIEWINDPDNNAYLHYDLPLEYEKTLAWFIGKDNLSRLDCTIEYDGVSVGIIGLLAIDRKNLKAEFYITVGNKEFKRKGIALCATQLLVKYAFEELGLHKIYLNVDAENVAACRLYEKAGFVLEGTFEDDIVHHNRFVQRRRYAIINKL